MEATALHLVQATVEQFIQCWEEGDFSPKHQTEFNADIAARFEGVRDYIVCHYKANKRHDTQYWRDNAANEHLSDSLRRVLHCWFQGGDMKQEIAQQDLARYYALTSWVCLLGGNGNYPEARQLRTPPEDFHQFDLAVIDDFIERCARNFADHREVLSGFQ